MYPIESLRIIAPIMLFVFIAINLVIGVFAGWKRAAYWGGGNFVFFIIGTLIWRGCGSAITSKIAGLVKTMLEDLGISSGVETLIKPVAAIVFGILIILITNLLLLINYYAWFKRVTKIGKYSNPNWKKIKAAKKAARKEGKKYTAPAVKPVKGKQGLKMQLINKLGGGIGFTALMLPPLFSTTTGIMYATTCTSTRVGNSFIENFYKNMNNCNKAFSWMSYYDAEAGDKLDALLSTAKLGTSNITYEALEKNAQKTENAFSAIFTVMGNGINNVINKTIAIKDGYESVTSVEAAKPILAAHIDDLIDEYNKLDASWSSIMNGTAGLDIEVVFNSKYIMELIPSIIQKKVTSKIEIKSSDWNTYYKYDKTSISNCGYFWQMLDALENVDESGKVTLKATVTVGSLGSKEISATSSKSFTKPATLTMNTECFEDLITGMSSILDLSQLTDETQIKTMKYVAAWMCGLMFYNEEYKDVYPK